MRKLEEFDITRAVYRIPISVRDLMKSDDVKLVVAGGFLRSVVSGDESNDLDLFTSSSADALRFAQSLVGTEGTLRSTENAHTVRNSNWTFPVQIIHRWTFDTPQALLESFDFTIAAAALWYDNDGEWQSLCADTFYSDLAAKRLVYTSPVRDEEPAGSLLRGIKFQRLGFHMPVESLGAVLARITSGIDLNTVNDQAWVEASTPEKVLAARFSGSIRNAY